VIDVCRERVLKRSGLRRPCRQHLDVDELIPAGALVQNVFDRHVCSMRRAYW